MKAGFGGAVRLVRDLAGVDGCLSGGELSVPGRTQAEASHTHIQGFYGVPEELILMCSQDPNILGFSNPPL